MSKLRISKFDKHTCQTLKYGKESIPYQVFFVPQQKNKISINVLPNGDVHVQSPENVALKEIKSAVQKRARWLYKHKQNIRQQFSHVLPRQYVSGECHYYLGRRYVLKVFKVKNIEPCVKLRKGQLQVRTKSKEPEVIKVLLNDWYRKHSEKVFDRRLDSIIENISWLKHKPTWKLRAMKKQWGSCSPKGVLSLNPQLVKAPRECIDYVLTHELCHIKEHNHSPRYYKLLKRLLPNWVETKAKLDGMSENLLAE